MIRYSNLFDKLDDKSQVFELIPNVYSDPRGTFSEVLKTTGQYPYQDYPMWLTDLNWVRQINRSTSLPGTIRGMHAQKGCFCQAKLVEAVTDVLYDVIIDARPQSKTFGTSTIVKLDPGIQNKLFVPRGFLHGFIVPKAQLKVPATFMYYCDNVYNHDSELCIRPDSVLPTIVKNMRELYDDPAYASLYETFADDSGFIYSEKDRLGFTYDTWMSCVKEDFDSNGRCWYK